MDGQTKLTRTNSSLLRSSPTIRSSLHSLSSVSEIAPDSDAEDLEEQKPHNRPLPPPVRSGAAVPLAAAFLLIYALSAPPPSSSSTRSSSLHFERFSHLGESALSFNFCRDFSVFALEKQGFSERESARRNRRNWRVRRLFGKAWSFTAMAISTQGSFRRDV
ncbi:hypothetical protein SASPL_155599 [Salvia splendens]|uniref:Uncharacterized protein n=1 Tax=Salvia splendens TaxID=180675 RepID=A0A8X8VYB7_SALSN|nr:hypothetical protein SASPL_155599 [Salvia splendens]